MGGKGKKAAAVGQETPYVKRVDLYKFLGKWLLRSYPDETGRPLMSPPDALQPARLRTTLDSSCSELLRRPLMGINLAAASVDGFTVFAEGLETQLQQLRGVLEAEPFLGAVRHLNLCRAVERDPAEGENACKAFLRGIRHIARDHGDSLAAAAEAAAAVYLALMSILEVAAVSGDFKAWAKEVPERTKHSKHLQAWLKDPEAGDKLYRAVAKWLKDDPEKNPGRRKRFGDLAAAAASSSVSLSDSHEASTDSSASKHKKKQKKCKKRGKRAKAPRRLGALNIASATRTLSAGHRKELR